MYKCHKFVSSNTIYQNRFNLRNTENNFNVTPLGTNSITLQNAVAGILKNKSIKQ